MRPVAVVELQVRAKARSRFYFYLLLPSLGAAVASAGLAAQAGGHPHVAPLAPGFFSAGGLLSPVRKVSMYMNQPDQSWNLGESPYGIDTGGALGADLLTTTPNFVPQPPTTGWQNHVRNGIPRTNIKHYVGSFRPPGGQVGPDGETRASFEVVAPAVIEAEKKVVVVLFTQPTFGPAVEAERPYQPHWYPGAPSYYDLITIDGEGTHVDVVERNLATNPTGYRVVGAQYTPRTSDRPCVSTMQRLRQTRRAVKHLLSLPPYNITDATRVAYVVSGASFGGFTSALAPLFYPTEFHGAAASAYTGAHRSMPSDYDALLFFTSLSAWTERRTGTSCATRWRSPCGASKSRRTSPACRSRTAGPKDTSSGRCTS